MKKFFLPLFEILKIVILALIIVLPIRYFIFQPFIVRGASMEPNFSEGDYLIVDQLSYRIREPERGEVVIFKYPDRPKARFIKRIVGLPGETIEIENGLIKISKNGKTEILEESYPKIADPRKRELKITLKENEYFVLGDNRIASFDSRVFGAISKKYIVGKVALRLWPIKKIEWFKAPSYSL
jgi:signal peptidase I